MSEETINKNLNAQRAQMIIDKINTLHEQFEHYKWIEKKWKRLGSTIRLVNVTVGGLTAGSLCVLGILLIQGVIIPPLLMGLLGSYSTIETVVLEGLNVGMGKKKKHKYLEKCNIIQDCVNKLHFYFEKARLDGQITLDELEGFNKLVTEFDNELSKTNIIEE